MKNIFTGMPQSVELGGRWFQVLVALIFTSVSLKGFSQDYFTGQQTGNHFNIHALGPGTSGISNTIQQHNSPVFSVFQFYYNPAGKLDNSNPTDFAELKATRLGAGSFGIGGDVYLQFRKGSVVPGGTTTYFDMRTAPTHTGLSLSPTQLVGLTDLKNIVGSGYSDALDYSLVGVGNMNQGAETSSPANSRTDIVVDKTNNYFAAVTPQNSYNSVRLAVTMPATVVDVGVVATYTARIHSAFLENSVPSDCAYRPKYTDLGNATGLTLASATSGLTLNSFINNAHQAIDDDANSYSAFSTDMANVSALGSLSQTVFLGSSVASTKSAIIKLGLSNDFAEVALFGGNIEIIAYNGYASTPVYSANASSLASALGIDLALLPALGTDHKELDLTVRPGVAFDRLEIKISSSAGLNLLNLDAAETFRLYDVKIANDMDLVGGSFPLSLHGINFTSGLDLVTPWAGAVAGGISGCPGYSYEVILDPNFSGTGPLPSTLTLSPTGELSGTPVLSDVGEHKFVVRTKDSEGQMAVDMFSVVIEESLPVLLSDFQVRKEGETALIEWEATKESNADRYEIERSSDAKHWNNIASKRAGGNSASISKYNFIDDKPLPGKNYYRLKMIDMDATYTYSRYESVDFGSDDKSLVYPNPFSVNENLKLNSDVENQMAQISFVNMSGVVVSETNRIEDIDKVGKVVPSGLYVLKVRLKDGTLRTQKILRK